jgi:tripartite-type tricarboxylate transporter receptor subunit TctC
MINSIMISPYHKLISVLLALAAGATQAQGWPAKPVRVIVPYLPGPTDGVLRLMSPRMQELLGQPLVIENRAGANGTIGANLVAQSAPDGYTLLLTNANPMVFGPATQKNIPYDPIRDFTALMAIAEGIDILVVNPSLPVTSVRELVQYAKANPGKLFYASPGKGSGQHLNGQNFNRLAGTDLTPVHYASYAQIIPAVISGQVPLAFLILQPIKPLVDAGKLKLLAVQGREGMEVVPGVQAIGETLPGYEKSPGWTGLFGPAKLPRGIVDRLHSAALDSINAPGMRARLAEGGSRVIANTPAEFATAMKEQVERTAKMVKVLGIDVSE